MGSSIKTSRLSKKDQFLVLLHGLAGHFKMNKSELTPQFLNDYWIGVMDYRLDQIAGGIKYLKENQEEPWFPNIATIKKAIVTVIRNDASRQLPAPTPNDSIDHDQREFNRLNVWWFKSYFGTFTLVYPITGKRKRNQSSIDGNDSDVANRKRVEYVQARLSDGNRFKQNQRRLNV